MKIYALLDACEILDDSAIVFVHYILYLLKTA